MQEREWIRKLADVINRRSDDQAACHRTLVALGNIAVELGHSDVAREIRLKSNPDRNRLRVRAA